LIAAVVAGILFSVVDGVISPHFKDSQSWAFEVTGFVRVALMISWAAALVVSAASLLRRKWLAALCYFFAVCVGIVSLFASAALRDDRFTFPQWSHREIADFYNERRSEFGQANSGPRLIPLGDRCHPPSGCECWVLVDPARTSGVEQDVGGWRRPTSTIFPVGTPAEQFATVNVKPLGSDGYSVLGCDMDWSAFWLR
jgi:hypothetical protein